ncbi:hypothetical protein C8R43DRAFT_1120161 [Mycena crocata]|nr:hypothetical protein C8R43DRAFT_1120161 [Mycena crocata]
MSGTKLPSTTTRSKLRSGTLSAAPQTLGNTPSLPKTAAPGNMRRPKSAVPRGAAAATAPNDVPISAGIANALKCIDAGSSPFLDPIGTNTEQQQGTTVPTAPPAEQSTAKADSAGSSSAQAAEEFPPLPAPGKEVMTGSPPRTRSPGSSSRTSTPPRFKGKGKAIEVLEDENLGGFLPTDMAADREARAQREVDDLHDPDLQRKIAEAKQRSLAAMQPQSDDEDTLTVDDEDALTVDDEDALTADDVHDPHLQRELEQAKQLSLTSKRSQSSKSPRRLEDREDSPPKRICSGPRQASGSGANALNQEDRIAGARLQVPSPLHPISNPVLPCLLPEFATVDNLPYGGDFGVAPEDPNEFPHIAGITSDTAFVNIGPDQTAAWTQLINTEPAILCYLSGGGSGNDDTDLATMKGMISIRTNAPLDSFVLSPPNHNGQHHISGYSTNSRYTTNPAVSPFLGCIVGLTAPTKEDIVETVIEALEKPENRAYKTHVLTHRQNTHKEMTEQEVWAIYLGKIHASRITLLDKNGVPHTAWHIYGRATTNITDHYLKTLDLFFNIDFRSNFYGQGKAAEAVVAKEAGVVLETRHEREADVAAEAEETNADAVLQEAVGEDGLVGERVASSPEPIAPAPAAATRQYDTIHMYML